MSETILSRVTSEFSSYTRGSKAVAQVVIDSPEQVLCMSLAELSERAGVSDPTVLRFTRTLGFSGFKDFKQQLAEELAAQGLSRRFAAGNESDDGSLQSMISWRRGEFNSLVDMIDDLAFDRAIDVLVPATRIVFWGQGSSAILARDARQTFQQAGFTCGISVDDELPERAISGLHLNDAIVAFSRLGTDEGVTNAVRTARKMEMPVVGVTVADAPLATCCTAAITLRPSNPKDFRSEMCLWMAQYFVIDALAVATTIRRGNAARAR